MQSQQQTSTGTRVGGKPHADPRDIFGGYSLPPGRYDELLTAAGEFRPAWQQFVGLLKRVGQAEFARRWEHSQRLIHGNGISYSAYGDPEGNARPWDLDAIPFLIGEAEWNQVSAGVAQRAKLLQLVLEDLLGPQRLIKEGVLPAEVLFGHSGFRLPFHERSSIGQSEFLDFYAADLGRDAQGRWWVLADRTEAPSGIGFALENRVVVSRMLPEIFRTCNVQRLAPFFMRLKTRLQCLSPQAQENPRIVIYSRGPDHENYFEDAYLARYLGYNLVEGGDLAVRDDKVWLKTLDGLMQIDVLLRRPNSEMCDPLEFSDESNLGVAGLLRAVHTNHVGVANSLGSGLVESPVFMAFMPRLCSFLLGENLLLPGIASWWCGEEGSLNRVLTNLDQYAISSAYRYRGAGYAQEHQLNKLPVDELRRRIQANPGRYVAQERPALSTIPRWEQGRATQSNLVLRSFALADDDGYTVLPGGLARTSDPSADNPLSIPASRGSKDTWILSSKPVEFLSLLSPTDEAIVLRRTGSDLPSRVADNIYWLGRHIERADAAARQFRTFVLQLTSETSVGTSNVTTTLLRALAAQGLIEPDFALEDIRLSLPGIDSALPRLVFDRSQAGGLRVIVDNMFRTASLVRDRLSPDTWRVLVRIDQQFQAGHQDDLTDLLSRLNTLIVDLAAIEGMCMESMTRSHVFRFLDLGRRLERALQTTELLQCCLIESTEADTEVLEALLEVADSIMTYRSRYLANLQMPAVLDLLLTDETNPRSIGYQLVTLQQQLEQLPNEDHTAGYLPHERLIFTMVHALRMFDVVQVAEEYSSNKRKKLEELLQSLAQHLQNLSHEVSNRYLVHTSQSRRLTSAAVTPPADSPQS